MTRREAIEFGLKGAGGLSLAAFLAACGGGAGVTTASPAPTASAGASGAKAFLPLTGTGTCTILDSGGPYVDGFLRSFHEGFRRDTGINSVQATRPNVEAAAAAQIKAQVETKQVQWDALGLGEPTYVLVKSQGLLEPIGLDKYDFHLSEMTPGAVHDDYLALTLVGLVIAYRTDKYKGTNVPKTFADFWDFDKFPGRRGVFKSGTDLMEPAVLSTGVAPDKLYPLDVNLAFKQLDKLKPKVSVWFDALSVSTQLLQEGSVDMALTFNTRSQPATDAGAPVQTSWGQWISQTVGWQIPKGAPNAENARKFLAYMTDAKRQAELTKYVKVGVVNTKAYEYIDKAIVDQLPGSPMTRPGMIPVDAKWRADNNQSVTDRFTTWFAS